MVSKQHSSTFCQVASLPSGLLDGGLGLGLGFGELMFPDQMLQEVIATIGGVLAIVYIASPPLEMAVAFVLVSNPVSFSLEDLGIPAPIPGTGKTVARLRARASSSLRVFGTS